MSLTLLFIILMLFQQSILAAPTGCNYKTSSSSVTLVTDSNYLTKEEKANIHKYAHEGHEFNHILEGKMKFFYKNQEMILEPGDSIYFDSGLEHAMIALGNKQLKFLAAIIN